MARPREEGLRYFPVDTEMSREVRLLESEYGVTGYGAFLKILSEAYKTKEGEVKFRYPGISGGFSAAKMYGESWKIPAETVEKMVNFMLEVDLFDKERFKKDGVLTSNGIKKRIEKIMDDRRRDRDSANSRHRKPSDKPSKTPEKKKEKKKKKQIKNDVFIPPTLKEVEDYCAERKNNIDAARFFNHYAATDWIKASGVAVVDWKALLRTWETPPPPNKRRPAKLVYIQYKAMRWEDKDIKPRMLKDGYGEHEIDEAMGKKH